VNVRARWALLTNEALRAANIAVRLRRDYRERVERRAAAREPAAADAAAPPQDLEQVRRQAREAWLQLRSTQAAAPESGPREHTATAAASEAEDERAL
jgi:hypothetical protein